MYDFFQYVTETDNNCKLNKLKHRFLYQEYHFFCIDILRRVGKLIHEIIFATTYVLCLENSNIMNWNWVPYSDRQ